MRLRILIWCIVIASTTFNMHAMDRERASSHSLEHKTERPLGAAITVLDVTGNFLSMLESVMGNLREQDKLKVSMLQAILDAAESRWKFGAVYAMEQVVGVTPDFAFPYLQRVAGACHDQGPGFITFLAGQKKEKKSFSDFLRAVRHGARYVAPNREAFNHLLSTNEPTINTVLQTYYPFLPAMSAGVKAMHASLIAQDAHKELFYDAQEELQDMGSIKEWQDYLDIQGRYEAMYAAQNECNDEFYDALDIHQFIDLDLRRAEGRDEGMTDWLK